MGASHFKELTCWQLSNELKIAVYAVLAVASEREDRSFCEDLKRSARSAPANIAEGFGRYSHREFAHFLSIARASLVETENHLQHLNDTRLLDSEDWRRLTDLCQRAQRAVAGLRAYLARTPDRR